MERGGQVVEVQEELPGKKNGPEQDGWVLLDTRLLASAMARHRWTAGQLARRIDRPGKRAINRWLRRGARTADGLIPVEVRYLASVARAFELPVTALVSVASIEQSLPVERHLQFAGALGRRVYPGLLRLFGLELSMDSINASGPFTTRAPDAREGLETWRFLRWSHCAQLLDDGAQLTDRQALQVRSWLSAVGLGPEAAPEIHHLCSVYLGEEHAALLSGVDWIRSAFGRGSFAEVVWLAKRVLQLPSAREPEARERATDVAMMLARAHWMCGRSSDAVDVLGGLLLPIPESATPARVVQVRTELSRVRFHTGDVGGALKEIRAAITAGEGEHGPEVAQRVADARLERLNLESAMGDVEAEQQTLRLVQANLHDVPPVSASRCLRLMGISALGVGHVAAALTRFEEAERAAALADVARDEALARLNIGICHAVAGRPELALRVPRAGGALLRGQRVRRLLDRHRPHEPGGGRARYRSCRGRSAPHDHRGGPADRGGTLPVLHVALRCDPERGLRARSRSAAGVRRGARRAPPRGGGGDRHGAGGRPGRPGGRLPGR